VERSAISDQRSAGSALLIADRCSLIADR